ncbi:hypothetical protein [Halorubrum salsamenti]|nr:hypothetical protein [Halorubrum salsamenti]
MAAVLSTESRVRPHLHDHVGDDERASLEDDGKAAVVDTEHNYKQ